MMAQFPALPLFTDAYLGDTTHLTTIEHGAYLLLLIVAWRSKDCKLPDDDKMLARYTKLSTAQWLRIKPVVLEFFTVDNGYLFQGRLLDELDTVKRLTMQRSNAGKSSALKRKHRQPTSVATESQRESAPTPTPTPTPIKKTLNGYHFDEFWDLYPRKISKKSAEKNYNKSIKDGVKHEDIIKGLQTYISVLKADNTPPKYIKHPDAWLNAGRWADEITEEKCDFERHLAEVVR